jgi:hypothetical protein
MVYWKQPKHVASTFVINLFNKQLCWTAIWYTFIRLLIQLCKLEYQLIHFGAGWMIQRSDPSTDNISPPKCTISYSMSTAVMSCGVEQPGNEHDLSLPFTAEVKNEWSYTSAPPIRLHGMNKDSFSMFKLHLFCIVCTVFVLFHLHIFIVVCSIWISVRTTATEWQLNCSQQ